MKNDNPYEPPMLDEPTSNALLQVTSAIVLAILAGIAFWQNFVLLGIIASVLLWMVLVWLDGDRSLEAFNSKWPAISDDEFLAKCGAGIDRETALKVRRIVSEQLGVEYNRIHPEQSFVFDLSCD